MASTRDRMLIEGEEDFATTELETRIDAVEDKLLKIAEDMNIMVMKLHETVISMNKTAKEITGFGELIGPSQKGGMRAIREDEEESTIPMVGKSDKISEESEEEGEEEVTALDIAIKKEITKEQQEKAKEQQANRDIIGPNNCGFKAVPEVESE